MSVAVAKDVPIQATLAATLTRLVPGDGVKQIQVSSPDAPFYVVFDNTLTDLSAVPATARMRYPAGVWPIDVGSKRILLAGVSGIAGVSATPTVTILGGAANAFGAAGSPVSSGGLTTGQVVGLQQRLFL